MNRAVLVVGFVMFVAMMGSNIPAPLYELYRVGFGTTTFAITAVFATYPIALVVMLIAFARLPDRIGRRPVLAIGVVAAALGSAAFLFARSIEPLFLGRALAAVAIGAIGAAGPPALVELDATHDRRRAALVATFAFSLACGVAPFVSGVLAVVAPAPLVTPFLLQLVLCMLAFVSLALVPETRPERPAKNASPVRLSPEARRAFTGAALTSGITWWLASLFVSIVPAFVAALLGAHSPALQGALALVVFVVSPVTQVIARGVTDRFASRAGLIGTVVALAALLGAPAVHSLLLFAVGSVVAGVAHGLGFLGAQSTINRIAPAASRAALSARFYAITYVCIGIPLLTIGALATRFGLYAALGIVAAIAALAALVLAATVSGADGLQPGDETARHAVER
jgi:predicted MFS family arabinose efflux permease